MQDIISISLIHTDTGCKTVKETLANTTAVPNEDGRILFYFVPDYTPTKR